MTTIERIDQLSNERSRLYRIALDSRRGDRELKQRVAKITDELDQLGTSGAANASASSTASICWLSARTCRHTAPTTAMRLRRSLWKKKANR